MTQRAQRRAVQDVVSTIQDHATDRPHHVALVAGTRAVTYRELDTWSDTVAARLLDRPDPAGLVAVAARRSVEFVVTLLGVLKAGSAYLPLDPTYPAERLAHLLADSGADLVVDATGATAIEAPDGVRRVSISDLTADTPATASPVRVREVRAADLAYLIYTSGSTGQPKGVRLTRGGLSNLVAAQRTAFDVCTDDRVLQFASPSFDASVSEIFVTLGAGATLCLPAPGVELDAQNVGTLLAVEQVTMATLPPSLLRVLDPARLPELRTVISAGERCGADVVARWAPGRRLINAYGPTETTVCATTQVCLAADAGAGDPPIGRAIDGVRVHVLDEHQQPVGDGEVGELYVGGAGVAAGYHRSPRLTAERFLPDPFDDEPGARMYRTGDLARMRPDGTVDYLGRADRQLKIRGFRVEPGEVEAAAEAVSGVRAAAVRTWDGPDGTPQLVAHVVAAADTTITAGQVQDALRERLPGHLCPDLVVVLPALPLTPNGKIDYPALPRPRVESGTGELRGPVEHALAEALADVLELDSVGPDDDFFALGCHSLMATQVVNRVRGRLGIDVPLRTFLQARTVRATAQRLVDATQAGRSGVTAGPRPEHVPATHSQQQLWALSQREGSNAAYTTPTAVRLRGPVDVPLLRAAINDVVARHEALRTSFVLVDGELTQVVHTDPAPVPITVTDLSGLSGTEQHDRLTAIAHAEARTPFDLQRAPLVRGTLAVLDDTEHVLVVTAHHIVADGWSQPILSREVSACYAARAHGGTAELPALTVQYPDYALWQRDHLSEDRVAAERTWWRDYLAGAPNGTDLPTDLPRAALRSFDGAMMPFQLSAPLAQRLIRLAAEHDATPHMVLLAALNAVLLRHTGQHDQVVGTITAGRTDIATEPLIGYFVNALVLRTDLRGDPSFAELLDRVRETALRAYAHQDLPFDLVVDAAGHRHESSRSPLFQIALLVRNTPEIEADTAAGFSVEQCELDPGTSKCDLSVVVDTGSDSMSGHIEYNTALFRPETITRFASHLTTLLAAACADPDVAVARLPLVAPDESARVLALGAPDGSVEVRECLPDLVRRQVTTRPEAVAVRSGAETLTYGELDRRSDALASALGLAGVASGDVVGVRLGRTPTLAVALLGVLKTGAAYLPLAGPGCAHTAQDVGVVVVDATTAGEWTDAAVPLLRVEDVPDHGTPDPVDITPDHVAAVLHRGQGGTSTTRPVSHRAVVRLVTGTTALFDLGPQDVWTLSHPVTDDHAVWEIWGALAHGAELVVGPTMAEQSPEALLDTVCAEGVTVLTLTPTGFRMLDEVDAANGRSTPLMLRHVFVSGAAVDPAVLRDWHVLRGAQAPLTYLYAPTGAAVDPDAPVLAAWHSITDMDLDRSWRAPIGRPLPGVAVTVLDERGQPVPVGVPGEPHVCGHGTGDLARWRADGVLEHLGRGADHVTVRGFGVDLGEVRSALLRQPSVRDAVITVETTDGTPSLVGHVLAAPGLDLVAVRRALLERRPTYSVPASLVGHEQFPLTAGGTVDTERLLGTAAAGQPDQRGSSAEDDPSWEPTETERTLLEVWEDTLALDYPIRPDDDFLGLGGDSIQAVRMVAEARQSGIDISIDELLLGLSLRELAEHADAATDVTAVSADTASAPALTVPDEVRALAPDAEDVFPAAELQTGMLYHSRRAPEEGRYHTVTSFRLGLGWAAEEFRAAVRDACLRHPMLRARFLEFAQDTYVVVEPGASIPVSEVDLRGLDDTAQDSAVDEWLAHERTTPLSPEQAPLIRFRVLVLGDRDLWFTITAHHAVMDGWSNATLLTELFQDYLARSGQLAPVPVPTAPAATFADFVAEERAVIADEATLDHWRQVLEHAPPTRIGRPTDPAGAGRTSYAHSVALPDSLSQGLRDLAGRAGVPLRTVLLTAHAAAIALFQGEREVVTGAVVNGRLERPDGDRVIGLFLNTVPVRAGFADGDWLAAVRSVAEVDRLAQRHRRFPLARLPRAATLFDTAFNFTHFHIYNQLRELPGVRVLEVRDHQRADLALVANFSLDLGSTDLLLRLDTDPGQLDSERVRTLAEVYRQVLTAMAAEPDQPWQQAGVVPESGYPQVLRQRSGPDRELPTAGVAELFRTQVAATPESVAIVDGNRPVTYRELSAFVDRLAAQLRQHGVVAGDVVGVCLPRSTASVATAVATLTVGAVLMPLDPAAPAARQAALLREADARLVVSTTAHRDVLPATPTVLELDRPTGHDAVALPVVHRPLDAPAFLLTTSGSTGVPKGVLLPHRALRNRLSWMWREIPFAEGERMSHKTASVFVDSLSEIFGGLLQGVPTVIVPDEQVREPQQLVATLAADGATRILLVPSLLRAMLERCPDLGARLPRLRWWLLTGEALTPALLAEFRRAVPHGRVLNMYGSTEVTDVTHADLTDPATPITAGTPLDNTSVFVLDAQHRPVGTGVAGRVYIAGHNVALGYHGDPERTAADFQVSTPLLPGGTPLFDTKDRGRVLVGGALDLLGRDDGGLKVHGHRLDPMEVEHALRTVPGVREAAVAVRRIAGVDALVGYLVADPVPPLREVRATLRLTLPDAAVPQAVVAVDELPRTPSGKVDRRALPTTVDTATVQETPEPAATGDAVLDTVLRLCREVFGRPGLGAHDDFFDHGANSVLLMRLAAGVARELGVDASVAQVFRTPTAASLAAGLAAPGSGRAVVPATVSTAPGRAYDAPLAFTQERLWFLDQIDPGNPAYNVTSALRLTGQFDPDAMCRALAALADRHDVLRAVFPTVADQPVQRVRPAGAPGLVPVRVTDLRRHPQPEAQAQRVLRDFAAQPFDLADGPLVRAVLLRTADQETVFGLNLHHIVCDGWSLDVIARELVALYAQETGGHTAELAALAVQFPDRAAWERTAAHEQVLAEGLRHWVDVFTPQPPALLLPTDRPRAAANTMAGDVVRAALPADVVARLTDLGRANDATLFMTLLACFAGAVRRWTGEPDVVIGVPVANRGPDVEDVVGFFANTLALRLSLPDNGTLAEFLRQTREVTLAAYQHQDTPFEQLVERLDLTRNTGGNPLFQIMFELEDDRADLLRTPGFDVEALVLPTGTAKFDLTMHVHRSTHGGLDLLLEYSTELFDRATVLRWLEQYCHLLGAVSTAAEHRLDALPVLSQAREAELVRAGVGPVRQWPSSGYADLFADQVTRRGDAPACVDGGTTLSYAELDRRSAAVATTLRAAGARPGAVVALSAPRGAGLITLMVGVLRTGAAFLPIDPALPTARRAEVLARCGPTLLAATGDGTAAAETAVAHADVTVPIVDCSAEAEGRVTQEDAVPRPDLRPADLAYVLFTSGSTGTPKGVMVDQRGMLNHIHAMVATLRLAPGDVLLQSAAQSFDISVWQMLTPLVHGGVVRVVDEDTARDPEAFAELLATEPAHVVEVVPTVLRGVLDAFEHTGTRPLDTRWMLVTGEAAQVELGRRWQALLPDVPLVNAYGPAECADDVTLHVLGAGELRSPTVPIGEPVANVRLYVVDKALRPTPLGSVGELCVGGIAVGRGYVNDARGTADRFLPDPFTDEPGARMYRTGDLVRYHADGSLEFVGRDDHQVKVRGFRIELGEVEAGLRALPGVADAVVTAGDDTLVGYLVLTEDAEPDMAVHRRALAERLPGYLVPSVLVRLGELPLNRNGKVDRAALPAPTATAGPTSAPPSTPMEQALHTIWAELLGTATFGVDDDFFGIGGHSMLATQVRSRIHQRLGVRLPLRTLFEAATLRELAVTVQFAQAEMVGEREMAQLLAQIDDMADHEVDAALQAMRGQE